MKKSAGNVTVTTEVGYCPSCTRTRTLRREERHLGGLVRINIDCETCHRTLSSTMAAAEAVPAAAIETPADEAPDADAAAAEPEDEPAPRPARKPAAATAKAPAAKKISTAAAPKKSGAKKKA